MIQCCKLDHQTIYIEFKISFASTWNNIKMLNAKLTLLEAPGGKKGPVPPLPFYSRVICIIPKKVFFLVFLSLFVVAYTAKLANYARNINL